MMEPFFGSPAPMWGAVASPGFGWTATAIPAVSRGAVATPLGAASQIRLPADVLSYNAPSVTPPGSIGIPGAFPTFVTTEIPGAPTAGAVVAAVAARRGQPGAPATDAEIEDFLYDVLELIPGTSDVEVRCEGGRATLSGNVPHKRHKRDVGEIAWAIPSVNDVQNSVTITARRRARGSGQTDTQSPNPVRKHG